MQLWNGSLQRFPYLRSILRYNWFDGYCYDFKLELSPIVKLILLYVIVE